MINITVMGIPPKTTAQGSLRVATKNGKAFAYKTADKNVEADWRSILTPHLIDKPMEGPLVMRVKCVFPFTKGHSSTKARRELIEHPDTFLPYDQKPDAGNIEKGLSDTMTKLGFWRDDKQVFDLRVIKVYGHKPLVSIRVSTWEGDTL